MDKGYSSFTSRRDLNALRAALPVIQELHAKVVRWVPGATTGRDAEGARLDYGRALLAAQLTEAKVWPAASKGSCVARWLYARRAQLAIDQGDAVSSDELAAAARVAPMTTRRAGWRGLISGAAAAAWIVSRNARPMGHR